MVYKTNDVSGQFQHKSGIPDIVYPPPSRVQYRRKYILWCKVLFFQIILVWCCPCLFWKFAESRPFSRTRKDVLAAKQFRESLKKSMVNWLMVNEQEVDVLIWWERLLEPGFQNLTMTRGKELNKERRCYHNLLMDRQAYLTRKIHWDWDHVKIIWAKICTSTDWSLVSRVC